MTPIAISTGNWFIHLSDSGKFTVYKSESDHFYVLPVAKAALREISDEVGFSFDPSWTTNQLGNKLLNFLRTYEDACEITQIEIECIANLAVQYADTTPSLNDKWAAAVSGREEEEFVIPYEDEDEMLRFIDRGDSPSQTRELIASKVILKEWGIVITEEYDSWEEEYEEVYIPLDLRDPANSNAFEELIYKLQ